ncbi:MAG: hypothetical protein Q9225_000949 [Loekoesia sp. 1 TL-2023]
MTYPLNSVTIFSIDLQNRSCLTLISGGIPSASKLDPRSVMETADLLGHTIETTRIEDMVMEGLAALGLAANVIQLVGAAVSAYEVCHEIYSLGASIEDSRMKTTSEELLQSYSVLKDSLAQSGNTGSNPLGSSVELSNLASKCCETATTLNKELQSLSKSSGGGFRQTVAKVGLKKRKAGKLEKLKRSLDEYEKALDSKSLSKLRVQQHGDTAKLERYLSRLSADLRTCHIPISNQLKAEIDRTITANEEQHAITRQHAETQITNAMHTLKFSQDQQRTQESQRHQLQHQYNRLLESLEFSEMNLRKNEVAFSHPETFEWMYDDDVKRPWNSSTAWLKGDQQIYWINGKPGSGKSTLIKFIATNPRTKELLGKWSPDTEPLVVTYYLWLAGSKMQRCLKGLLCSVIHQILMADSGLYEKFLQTDKTLLTKWSVNDWSDGELQRFLLKLINLPIDPVCIFIDGLDEFDKGDDIENLLSFIEALFLPGRSKVCVSSRPESYIVKRLKNYRKLRLQDLTAGDMRLCIRNRLEVARAQCQPAPVDDKRIEDIIEVIAGKADGVFLWVHYALSSLVRGMRNEDDFRDPLDRIEQLPSEMSQLYLQMWNRLNEDQKLYRDEATTYFSYAYEYPELSLFELLVALDHSLQDDFLKNFEAQDPVCLTERCQQLESRILTRCAGLLEIVREGDSDQDPYLPVVDESVQELGWFASSHKYNFLHVPKTRMSRFACHRSSVNERVFNRKEARVRKKSLIIQHKTEIGFLHQTAKEFLLETKDGKDILGKPMDTDDMGFRNVKRAQIAACVQGLAHLNRSRLFDITHEIGKFGGKYEEDLFITIKRYYEYIHRKCNRHGRILKPRPYVSVSDWGSMKPYMCDFETMAAYNGCTQYIRRFIQKSKSYISPYYRGLLVLFAAAGIRDAGSARVLALISWLGSTGADVLTNHVLRGCVFTPVLEILLAINRALSMKDRNVVKKAAAALRIFLPVLRDSSHQCLLSMNPSVFCMHPYATWWGIGMSKGFKGKPDEILIQMSVSKLCLLTIKRLERCLPLGPQWGQVVLRQEDLTKVVFYFHDHHDDPNPRSGIHGVCPSSDDSIHLGQALYGILLKTYASKSSEIALSKELETLLWKLPTRGAWRNFRDWKYEAGWLIDSSRLSSRPLNPTEDVDESNWMEKGHFKRCNAESDTDESDFSSDVTSDSI